MIILTADPDNIPGMPVFDLLVRIVVRERHDAPDSQGVTQNLECLGNPFADPDSLLQGTCDLMGIGFFQLVITDVPADKIMDEKKLRDFLLISDLSLLSFPPVPSTGPVAGGAGVPAAGAAKADFLCLGGLPDQLLDPGPHGLLLGRDLLPVR